MNRRRFLSAVAGILAWAGVPRPAATSTKKIGPFRMVEIDVHGFYTVRMTGEAVPDAVPVPMKGFRREWIRYEFVSGSGTIRYEVRDVQFQRTESA